ncbi:hypothetical protein B0T16DRAFT_420360 [Cercophora newfieldiana]|uniref:ATP synthase subunit K, mitochondrial n=1 Tax=Cercophora newfieldiana TaxID=92897 RepID=A0AA39XWT3_9PEZI|nr:hypothetical protein B0T16DRAFT_420360 [Cercophora newfieldiana]
MTQSYNIFGRQVASHYLAMATLATLFGTTYAVAGGGAKTPATPPLNASSSDEADFIKKYIEHAEDDAKKAAPKH